MNYTHHTLRQLLSLQRHKILSKLKRNAELEFIITPPSGITAVSCLPGGGVFILPCFQQDWICGTQSRCFRQRLPSVIRHRHQQLLSWEHTALCAIFCLLAWIISLTPPRRCRCSARELPPAFPAG